MRYALKINDCSFRDCGFYNNHHFNRNLVNKRHKKTFSLNIDNIEIGFGVPVKNKINQNYEYC
jgi:hypothetical protein